jgi:preprotein translocase subunit SecA
MTQAPMQADLAVWHTLRTRRRQAKMYRGLDGMANRWGARFRHARTNMAYLRRQAEAIDKLGATWRALSEQALDEKVLESRTAFGRHAPSREQIRIGLATVREVARRERGEEPYVVQLMGVLGLFHGQIVEMVTGEGKTLVGAVAATMLAWLRRPVHVVTVNDYLAQRDADMQAPIYRRCGLQAGAVTGETPEPQRLQAYRLPIVYLTQKELVADWLRDELRLGRVADPVSTRWQGRGGAAARVLIPGLFVAIVDEIDAVLIDEAVTPLIIAQPRQEDAQAALYGRARDLANELTEPQDFRIDHKKRRADLSAQGRRHVEELLQESDRGIWHAARRREELVEQALVAAKCYHAGVQYQVVEDQIVIVDEYTGRYMKDRQWQHGLHQAVEAKHDLEVTADRDTLASMSFQRFFRLYPHLCGMTGTAADARPEMETTYSLPVRIIPTNRPLRRTRMRDQIFMRAADKWDATLRQIEQMHNAGRPVLVGTRSIEASEHLSGLLAERDLEHQVLNAVHHKVEADIVEQAGEPGRITVATNMAGRGTDIILGTGVQDQGGLHVILTERHNARRIDRQLIGRAGRQGDQGSARVIISLEDELLTKRAGAVVRVLRKCFGPQRQRPLPRWIVWVFDLAQIGAQRDAARSRARVLRHDEDLDRSLPR